jgi:glycosyltransferase involved in cell wall biosynthesis
VGKTDGVSLEIEAWTDILTSLGTKVSLCSGPVSEGADYVIDELEQQLNPVMYKIDENAFGGLKDFSSNKELNNEIKKQQEILQRKFQEVIKKASPTHLIVSNIFSVGEGLPAAGALITAIDKFKVPTILIHHDFYWENKRYDMPTNKFVRNQLEKHFPPDRKYIKHLCINSLGQRALQKRKGLNADIIYDTFKYNQPRWEKKPKITEFLKQKGIKPNDIVMLQATRIVRRKNIELAIDLTAELAKSNYVKTYANKNLPNKKRFDPDKNKIVLLLSGYVEKRARTYLAKLKRYADSKQVNLKYLGNHLHKEYELFDIYPYADIITYPSQYEGFGNQLLEAFFANKIPVIFEYPVFKSDIMPLGFKYISLGDKIKFNQKTGLVQIEKETIKTAAAQVSSYLNKPALYRKTVESNFKLAADNFSFKNTSQILTSAIKEG